MPLDPSLLIVQNADPQRNGELADIRRRLTALEQARPTIQQLTGTPTTTPRDGTPAVDTTSTGKLWLRVNGVWRFTALT